MNARRRNFANVLAAGVATTVLVLTGLCWGRSLCATLRHNWLFHVVPEMKVAWSSPFPWERESEPNSAASYYITARPQPDAPFFAGLGILQYALARMPMGPRSDVYYTIGTRRALGSASTMIARSARSSTRGPGKPPVRTGRPPSLLSRTMPARKAWRWRRTRNSAGSTIRSSIPFPSDPRLSMIAA